MKYFIAIFLLSLLPIISLLFTPAIPHTHDGAAHLPRIGAYFKALADGQIPVRWAGDLNYGYGMPLFNFIYPLPYFLSSLLILLGFGLANSFEIVLVLSYILSGVFMYAFGIAFFKDEKKAFLVAVLYQFAPFRLVDLLVRGSFGEVYTYTFLPLVLFGLTRLFQKQIYTYFLLTAVGAALLVLSHNALSLVFFGICFLFVIVFGKEKTKLLAGFSALIAGLMLAGFYWLPAILEHRYTYGDLFMKQTYLSHFPPFVHFLIPNLTNDIQLLTGGISVQFGLFHTIAVVLSVVLLFKKKVKATEAKLYIFSLTLLLLALFIMQPVSQSIWANVSLLRQFQFPWRFLSVVVVATALLSISFLYFDFFRKKWAYYGLIFLVVISTVYYWRAPLGFDTINEQYYWNYPLNTTYFGETDLIWSKGQADGYPKKPVEPKSGTAYISNYKKKSHIHTYTVDAVNNSAIVDHTQYFPGWRVYVDGRQVPIEFQDLNWRGEITFPVSRGKHDVRVEFGESPLRLFADLLSVFSLLTLFLAGIFRNSLKRFIFKKMV